jgi:hypothetical protein
MFYYSIRMFGLTLKLLLQRQLPSFIFGSDSFIRVYLSVALHLLVDLLFDLAHFMVDDRTTNHVSPVVVCPPSNISSLS